MFWNIFDYIWNDNMPLVDVVADCPGAAVR